MLNKFKKRTKLIIRSLRQKGNLKYKINYYRFSRLAEKNGVIDFRWDRIAKEYTHDWMYYDHTSKEDKKWAYQQGFASYKMKYFGMNRENYEDYISDFVFYNKNNYMNRKFESWFDNKMNTYYLLSPMKENMPRHYWYINDGKIMPLDIEKNNNGTVNDIIELIKGKCIAAKACTGGHGVGFYKFEYIEGEFYANNEIIEEKEVKNILSKLDDYIITDYVKPDKKYHVLCGDNTFVVIRVITIFDEQDGAQLTSAVVRLGTKAAGTVCDYEGTIYCGLTMDEGIMYKPLYRKRDDWFEPYENHPDTNVKMEGHKIYDWNSLCELVKRVSRYVPMTPYLVMDIIPGEDGFKILEINSHGQPIRFEPYYPFMKNKYNRKTFVKK